MHYCNISEAWKRVECTGNWSKENINFPLTFVTKCNIVCEYKAYHKSETTIHQPLSKYQSNSKVRLAF